MGYSPRGHKDSDMTEQLHFSHSLLSKEYLLLKAGTTCSSS